MKTILITGSDGQLGNEIKQLSSEFTNYNFLFTDVDSLDITDFNSLKTFFSENSIHYIINCAAYTNVDKAEIDLENAEKINAFAVQNLAILSKEYKAPFIHISTDYVFDGKSKIPYKESDKTNPQSVYGKTKLLGEKFAEKAYKHIIIRTAWLYSSFGHNFVKTILKLGNDKNEISVVSDQIGSPSYAKDLAEVILHILTLTTEDSANFIEGIFHFSNEGTCSWHAFSEEIMKQKGLDCFIKAVPSSEYPTAAERPKYSLLDKSKIKQSFEFEVRNWKDALKECLSFLD